MILNRFFLLLSAVGTCATGYGAQTPPKDVPLPVPFRLTSDGHACSGFLDVRKSSLVWKSAFSVCTSSAWTIEHGGDAWIFKLTPTAAAKSCSIRAIRMHPVTPVERDSLWEVSGFNSVEDAKEHPRKPVLDCMMQ